MILILLFTVYYEYVIELNKFRNNLILGTRFTGSERIPDSNWGDKQINSLKIQPEQVVLNKFCLCSPTIFILLEIAST